MNNHIRVRHYCWFISGISRILGSSRTGLDWVMQIFVDVYLPGSSTFFRSHLSRPRSPLILLSIGWFKGKSTGNHRFSQVIWEFPAIFPLNQPIDIRYLITTCVVNHITAWRWTRRWIVFQRRNRPNSGHPSPLNLPLGLCTGYTSLVTIEWLIG